MNKSVCYNICDIIQLRVPGNGYVQSIIHENFHNFYCNSFNEKIKPLMF